MGSLGSIVAGSGREATVAAAAERVGLRLRDADARDRLRRCTYCCIH